MLNHTLQTYLDQCLAGPVLPATLLMVLIVMYGGLVILGALDFDLLDLDLDADADADLDASSLGFVALKFLNIGELPLMIWLCIFGLSWWMASLLWWVLWDEVGYAPGYWSAGKLVVRNLAVALLATKVVTDPMARLFEKPVQRRPRDMIGRDCVITTYEATPEFGQASHKTEAAPMLLNVQTRSGTLSKGDIARIVDYDPDRKVYLVEPSTSRSQGPAWEP